MAAYLMNSKLSAGGKITDTCEDPFTREQLYEKIVEIFSKEDAEMSAMGYPQANMLIPKLCLMLVLWNAWESKTLFTG